MTTQIPTLSRIGFRWQRTAYATYTVRSSSARLGDTGFGLPNTVAGPGDGRWRKPSSVPSTAQLNTNLVRRSTRATAGVRPSAFGSFIHCTPYEQDAVQYILSPWRMETHPHRRIRNVCGNVCPVCQLRRSMLGSGKIQLRGGGDKCSVIAVALSPQHHGGLYCLHWLDRR